MERPVEFSSLGQRLRGVLHIPEGETRKEPGVIFLNAGLIYRAGPYRLYVEAARALSQQGFPCLRFDFPGVGDSEGAVKPKLDYNMFTDTSHTRTAVEVLMRETGVHNVALMGICTGARNAIWTAREDARIDSLVLLSMPVTLDRSKTWAGRLIYRNGRDTATFRTYRRLKSTFVWKALREGWLTFVALEQKYHRLRSLVLARVGGMRSSDVHMDGGDMLASCQHLMSEGRRLFFIYGEYDEALVRDFLDNIGSSARYTDGSGRPLYDYWVVEGAHHVFPGVQTHQLLIDRLVTWLTDSRQRPVLEQAGDDEPAQVR